MVSSFAFSACHCGLLSILLGTRELSIAAPPRPHLMRRCTSRQAAVSAEHHRILALTRERPSRLLQEADRGPPAGAVVGRSAHRVVLRHCSEADSPATGAACQDTSDISTRAGTECSLGRLNLLNRACAAA